MLWIVKGDYCGCHAVWGAYPDKGTADEMAKRVNGTVEPWEGDIIPCHNQGRRKTS